MTGKPVWLQTVDGLERYSAVVLWANSIGPFRV
jgi:hypothetical protein